MDKKTIGDAIIRALTQKVDLDSFLGYINVVYGEKWSWKTYYFVKCAFEAYLKGYTIISNVWVDFPHVRFTNTKSLVPILREIALYSHFEKWPIEAPKNFLKAYWMERKTWEVEKFYILFDEIGIHLNHRNWSKNFRDELLVDMIMEPRKYNLTMVGICQDISTVDIEFLKMATRWFSVRKWGRSFWESVFIHGYPVRWWVQDEISYASEFYSKRYFHYFQKKYDLSEFRWWLYYTGEVSGAGTRFYANIPNRYTEGCIYKPPPGLQTTIPLLLTDTVSEDEPLAANMGERESAGASPTNIIPNSDNYAWSILNEETEKKKTSGKGAARKKRSEKKLQGEKNEGLWWL